MLSPWELPFGIGIPDVCVQLPEHSHQPHVDEARDQCWSPLVPDSLSGHKMVTKVNGQTSPAWSGHLPSCQIYYLVLNWLSKGAQKQTTP